MKNDDLPTYLNDHLAGSVGAIEMIDHLIEVYKGKPIAQFCKELRDKITADQEELKEMMRALEIKESSVRQAGAWIGEKLGRFKLRPEGEGAGDFGLFLAFEALVLGIMGKRSLWASLETVQNEWPELQRFDLARLQDRAIGQAEQVDAKRLEAAREALRPQ
jgi:hypothetical protein